MQSAFNIILDRCYFRIWALSARLNKTEICSLFHLSCFKIKHSGGKCVMFHKHIFCAIFRNNDKKIERIYFNKKMTSVFRDKNLINNR